MVVITPTDLRDHPETVKALQAAVAAAERGDWRACVDQYKKAFRKSGAGFSSRYHCLSGVSASLLDDSTPGANKDDMKFLEAVHDDEREMAVNRTITAYTKGEPARSVCLFGHCLAPGKWRQRAERRS